MVKIKNKKIAALFSDISLNKALLLAAIWLFLNAFWMYWAAFAPVWVQRYDRTVFDMRMRNASMTSAPDNLICIMAGEASVKQIGRWPWQRDVHAQLLAKLGGAKVVLLDILFPDPSDNTAADEALAQAAYEHGNVVAAVYLAVDAGGNVQPVVPYDSLAQAVSGFGVSNVEPDIDGVFRRFRPLWTIGEGSLAPSLALEAVISYTGMAANVVEDDGHRYLELGEKIKASMDGDFIWVSQPKTPIPTYEYIDVLSGAVPPETFDGKIVIVGVGAAGTGDIVVTPNPDKFGVTSKYGAQFVLNSVATTLSASASMPPKAASAALAMLAAFLVTLPVYWAGLFFGIKFSLPVLVVSLVSLEGATEALFRRGVWLSSLPFWIAIAATFGIVIVIRAKWLDTERSSQKVAIGGILELLQRSTEAENRSGMTLEGLLDNLADNLPVKLAIDAPAADTDYLQTKFGEDIGQEINKYSTDMLFFSSPKGSSRHYLALPLPRDEEEEPKYALLGWDKKLEPNEMRAMAALLSTSVWCIKAINEMDERRLTMLDTVSAMVEAVDARDEVTGGHSKRVCDLSIKLAKRMGFTRKQLEELQLGAIVHDIGKLGIPDAVLGKQGKLTDEEFAIIRSHPRVGEKILEKVHMPEISKRVMIEHHEKFAGGGYPRGLKGEEISIEGRISAVADVFDALYSDRPYKKGWPLEEIHAFMQKRAGEEFDPQVVLVMLEVIEEMQAEKAEGEKAAAA